VKLLIIALIFSFSFYSFSCEDMLIGEVEEVQAITPIMFAVFQEQFDSVRRPKPPKCPNFEDIDISIYIKKRIR
jgi:hypothetical protein